MIFKSCNAIKGVLKNPSKKIQFYWKPKSLLAMFESILASILNRILGKYIDNLEYNQLKLGIWNGKSLK